MIERFTNKDPDLGGVGSDLCRWWLSGVDAHQWELLGCFFSFFFFSKICTVRWHLLSSPLDSLFGWAPWQRPALSFAPCTLLTLAAVSFPQRDKTILDLCFVARSSAKTSTLCVGTELHLQKFGFCHPDWFSWVTLDATS